MSNETSHEHRNGQFIVAVVVVCFLSQIRQATCLVAKAVYSGLKEH